MRALTVFSVCLLTTFIPFAKSQGLSGFTGDWLSITEGYDIRIYEEEPSDVTASVVFYCEDGAVRSEIEGLDYTEFEDPDFVSMRFLTEEGPLALNLAPPEDFADFPISSDFIPAWIEHIKGDLPSSAYGPSLKIQVTVGFYERVHEFFVLGFDEALKKLGCS